MRYLIFVLIFFSVIFLYSAKPQWSPDCFGDDDSALVYIKKAQELVKKRDYKEALKNFNKAINEAPELPDVYLALGEMYREIGESTEAIANFDKTLNLLQMQSPSEKVKSLQVKINSYINEYEKLRQELPKINEQFLKSLLPLIEKYGREDPDFALLICEKGLRINPADEIFINKKKELLQKLAEAKKEQMVPLYNEENLDGWSVETLPADRDGQHWSIENNIIKFESKGWNRRTGIKQTSAIIEGDYNIIAKIKLGEVTSQGNFLLLSFGFQNIDAWYGYGFWDQKLVLAKYSGMNFQKLNEKDIPANIDIFDWNELGVEVYNDTVRCYLNGELYFDFVESNKELLRNKVALIGWNCSGYFKDILYLGDE